MKLGTNFWNIGWGIKDDMFKPNTVFVDGQNPWNPVMLQEVGIYKVIRTMDWTPNSQFYMQAMLACVAVVLAGNVPARG